MGFWRILFAQSFDYTLTKDRTVEPLNKGHFGDNINSADLSFVERFITLCPYLGDLSPLSEFSQYDICILKLEY